MKNPNENGVARNAKFREKKVKCFGAAEDGAFAEIEGGGRIYGIVGAAPDLLAVVEAEAAMFAGRDADEWAPEMAARIRAMRAAIAKAKGGVK